jgi:hypothetical protein
MRIEITTAMHFDDFEFLTTRDSGVLLKEKGDDPDAARQAIFWRHLAKIHKEIPEERLYYYRSDYKGEKLKPEDEVALNKVVDSATSYEGAGKGFIFEIPGLSFESEMQLYQMTHPAFYKGQKAPLSIVTVQDEVCTRRCLHGHVFVKWRHGWGFVESLQYPFPAMPNLDKVMAERRKALTPKNSK